MGYFRLVDDSSLITARTVYSELEIIMAIVFILPGLLLITLGIISLLGIATPESKPVLALVTTESEREYRLAA
jgi:hypothetical protein